MNTTLTIDINKTSKSKIASTNFDDLKFGQTISDHMFVAEFENGNWGNFRIEPYAPLQLNPANATLHYGQSVFEGMKAYKNADGEVLIFRADANQQRLNESARRMCIPEVPEEIFMEGLKTLIQVDADWIPNKPGYSLYIRPFVFATDDYLGIRPSEKYKFIIFTCPVGNYYAKPVSVKVETKYTRAAEGGTGSAKAAGNYAGSLYPALLAQKEGFDQLLWTDGKSHQHIEESGTMNVMFMINDTLITAPTTTGTILKGITRDSVLTLAKEMGVKVEERFLRVTELEDALVSGSLKEAFGTGTAATIAHIAKIHVNGNDYELPEKDQSAFSNQVLDKLDQIKYGKTEDNHGWIIKL
ncbi:branched-chain amino acid aminotransferase [Belliella kenyensis]|uniref:branched-chain-amino-acid transaminase n=1 Tax=Belliella kenyensis TaxID=1472724 RepID=A0ABV8EQZ6_9BACT|nr:branched-chain amino acid aminotransferase [Belliella kenyensis]MCH7402082.1 branched-chain amino acid aminotransferase [Belliella kenyensis]MDN3601524.1 branched-chain amino acid aminotransferase [Belliella kenyensis]MDN3605246.1 branched-chain amino acid aminotransferase [Belliella kenyensis]